MCYGLKVKILLVQDRLLLLRLSNLDLTLMSDTIKSGLATVWLRLRCLMLDMDVGFGVGREMLAASH